MMLSSFGSKFSQWVEYYMPSPFIFAILLTFIVFFVGMGATDHSPEKLIDFWYSGFWSLLGFSMQMCFILVTGYALAVCPLAKKMTQVIAEYPQSQFQATFLVAFISILMGLVNWGLAIIVGAFLAREVAISGVRREIPFHYPLLGAAGYMGLAVWHGGFSGSAPLLVATDNHFLVQSMGVIGVEKTLLSPINLIIAASFLIGLPLFISLLTPKDPSSYVSIAKICPEAFLKDDLEVTEDSKNKSFADKLETSKLLGFLISLLLAAYLARYFYQNGLKLNLNIVNLLFLLLGLLGHQTPRAYMSAVTDGMKSCAGVLLLFPFYGGVMGLMKGSELATIMSDQIVSVASETTYPLFVFFSAMIVNIFVPSGGGQWALQGPIVIEGAKQMGLDLGKVVMAFSYGDQWSNLLQPFWAIALLGITGLKAGQIIGYCVIVMLVGILFISGVLFFL